MRVLKVSYQKEFAPDIPLDNSDFSAMVGMEFDSVTDAMDYAFQLGNKAPVKLIFEKQSGIKMISFLSKAAKKRITKPVQYNRRPHANNLSSIVEEVDFNDCIMSNNI